MSPLTSMGVSGVICVQGQVSLGYIPADYSPELDNYARSLGAGMTPRTIRLTKDLKLRE